MVKCNENLFSFKCIVNFFDLDKEKKAKEKGISETFPSRYTDPQKYSLEKQN